MRVVACLAFIFFPSLVSAQLEHGTVVVFIASSNRIIVAADSRASGYQPNDNSCKIVALGRQLLFTAAGVAAHAHTIQTSRNWSVQQQAVRAFRALGAKPSDAVSRASDIWLRSMKRIYLRELKLYPRQMLSSTINDALMNSAFVGVDQAGQLKVREIGITFNRAVVEKSGAPVLTVTDNSWHLTGQPVIKIAGHSEIIQEFQQGESERARADTERWNLEMNAHRNEDTDLLYAVFLVDLTSSYAPAEFGVGGPVDEVEIFPKSGIQWIQRKTACPVNSVPGND